MLKNHVVLIWILVLLVIIFANSQIIQDSITQNVIALKVLSSYSSRLKDDISIDCDIEFSDNYIHILYCVDTLISKNETILAKRFIEMGKDKFPNDIDPLYIRESRLYWADGKYSQSCLLLQEIENLREMTDLASLLYEQQNWEGLETYLQCIGSPRNYNVKYPSHKISELNFFLGKHYEQIGLMEKALTAYDNSASWYPTVWADPVLASAEIREELGRNNEAKNIIQRNYKNSTLPWSKFFLGLKLGLYMEEEGEYMNAYCVYINIIEAAYLSPMHLVPEDKRNEVINKIALLENHHGFLKDICE